MTPFFPPRRQRGPVLLVAGAFGFWLFVVAAFIAALPDRITSPDQPERLAWVGE